MSLNVSSKRVVRAQFQHFLARRSTIISLFYFIFILGLNFCRPLLHFVQQYMSTYIHRVVVVFPLPMTLREGNHLGLAWDNPLGYERVTVVYLSQDTNSIAFVGFHELQSCVPCTLSWITLLVENLVHCTVFHIAEIHDNHDTMTPPSASSPHETQTSSDDIMLQFDTYMPHCFVWVLLGVSPSLFPPGLHLGKTKVVVSTCVSRNEHTFGLLFRQAYITVQVCVAYLTPVSRFITYSDY